MPLAHSAVPAAADCPLTAYTYDEPFAPARFDAKASSPGYADRAGYVALGQRAGGFSGPALEANVTYPSYQYQRLFAATSGDYNGDGTDDLVMGSSVVTDSYDVNCSVDFFANKPGGLQTSSASYACNGRYNAAMATGDVNGDGRPDVLIAGMDDNDAFGVNKATLYLNITTVATKVKFTPIDVSALFVGDSVVWHVGGSQLAFADYDGDGRDDLFVLSSAGTNSRVLMYPSTTATSIFQGPGTVLLSNAGLATPIATASTAAPVAYACMPSLGKSIGGTVLVPADFNNDGLLDLVVGSASENKLYYFRQNSGASFDKLAPIVLARGGALLAFAGDIDRDGTTDLVYFRSGNHCDGSPGEAYILYNDNKGKLNASSMHYPYGHSLSFAAMFNYDRDKNQTLDFFAGRHNVAGRYAAYINNTSSTVYNLSGVATSLPLASLDGNSVGVVDLAINKYQKSIPSGTAITVQFSNDGGSHWETLRDDELSGTEIHTFSHFGADLRWRVLAAADAQLLAPADQIYAPGSTRTPKLTGLGFTYNVAGKNTYSRSGNAAASFGSVANPQDYLYAASFVFPTNLGNLVGYNISKLTAGSAATGSLEQVTGNGNVSTGWDAGALLQARTGSTRTLYLTAPQSSFGTDLPDVVTYATTRLAADDAGMLSTSQASDAYAKLLSSSGSAQARTPGLAAYMAEGMGEPSKWKLRDPGHASPVTVGVPRADASYMGSGYAAFVTAQQSRAPVVLQGANDGMLHAFGALDGKERWGLVPFNLFERFAAQVSVGGDGKRRYVHQVSVDGTPVVADIYAGGSWRTVAVGAQGEGVGIGGSGYYYALDVTDPLNPKPLWEFSDVLSDPATSCDVTSNCTSTCQPACTSDPSTCYLECNQFASFFAAGSTPGFIAFSHYDDGVCRADPYYGALCTSNEYSFYIDRDGTYDVWVETCGPNGTAQGSVGFDYGSATRYYSYSCPRTWKKVMASFLFRGEHSAQLTPLAGLTSFGLLAVQPTGTPMPLAVPRPAETCITVCPPSCVPVCTAQCIEVGKNVAWPQCGENASLQCCGTRGSDQYCAPVGTCGKPEPSQGQTHAVPSVGRLATAQGDVWAVFLASGYSDQDAPNVGRGIYALNAFTGALVARWDVDDVPGPQSTNPSNIDNTLPGGVALVDIDNDGYVDRAYFGDLEGRLRKIDLSKRISGTTAGPADYPMCVLFDAGDPQQTGQRNWAPIVHKPAVAVLDPNSPNVYFGTGGDNRAPSNVMYKFYAIRDTDARGVCRATPLREQELSISRLEWVMGDGKTNTKPQVALSGSLADSEGVPGERFWADPLVVNNNAIYFTSLPGNIESVNACSGGSQSRIYAYALSNFFDANGKLQSAGTSLLDNNAPYLLAFGKVRRSAMMRGGLPGGPARPSQTALGTTPRADLFFQSYTGASPNGAPVIQRLSTVGTSAQRNRLNTRRWREISL